MAKQKVTTESFLKKYHETRALICDGGKSIDEKLAGLTELSKTFSSLKITEENDHCQMAMQAFCTEAIMRLGYQAEQQLGDVLDSIMAI